MTEECIMPVGDKGPRPLLLTSQTLSAVVKEDGFKDQNLELERYHNFLNSSIIIVISVLNC